MVKRKAKAGGASKGKELDDWLTKLAKESNSEEGFSRSKSERIEHRNRKKRRREERKVGFTSEKSQRRKDETVSAPKKTEKSKAKLLIVELAAAIEKRTDATHGSRPVVFDCKPTAKHKRQKWDSSHLQPRKNDYGGIGLARESAFLPLDDPSFRAKLEEEFAEHIPGFFGRTKRKAMKKQLDKDMLWRKLADRTASSIKGKKLKGMSPDERVEAFIAAGLV